MTIVFYLKLKYKIVFPIFNLQIIVLTFPPSSSSKQFGDAIHVEIRT